MKKMLLILCLIMLTGCSHKTLEEKMQGQWIITERTVLIERKNGDYTEFYTKVDLQTNELIEYKRNGIDIEFIKLQTTKSEEAFIIVEYSGNQNIISSGGQIDTGPLSFIVEPSGNFNSTLDIANTYINIPDSENFIALKDIVTLRRDFLDPPDKLAYFNGQQAIFFATSMLPEYNLLEYAPRVMQKINDIEATLPVGYKMNIATYQAEQVEKTIQGVSMNVLQTH